MRINLKSTLLLKPTIEGNAQYTQTTQHIIQAKALNATHSSKFKCKFEEFNYYLGI